MNILVVNHYAGSVKHGMEYRHFYLAREWLRLGHRVTIAAASFSHLQSKSPDFTGLISEEEIQGIRYIWLRTPEYHGNGVRRAVNIASFGLRLWSLKNEIVRRCRPDLVVASSPHPLAMPGAVHIARAVSAALFFEVRDLWPLTLTELGGLSRAHPFVRIMQWAENYAYKSADRVVSLLPKADGYMRAHGMAKDKFVYVPNGIDVSEWEKINRAPLSVHHAEAIGAIRQKGHFILGYAGSHGIANELHTLLGAAEIMADSPITFILVGQGPEKENLQRRVKEKALQNVVFLESVQKNEIPDLLACMDALYIGLKNEPLFRFGISPNKLMDYMMAGKPIIHAVEAGNDLVAESGCGLSVPPENSGAISEAAIRLMGMTPAEREKMGYLGREYVLANHDYRVLAKRLLDPYER